MTPVLLLLISVLLFRVAPSLGGEETIRAIGGWSPLLALALCGGAFFPKKWALVVSLTAVLVPHFLINHLQGFPAWDSNLALLVFAVMVAAGLGLIVGKKARISVFLGVSVMSTASFHVMSNTIAFLTLPEYSSNFLGWLQAQTTGLPQYAPQTWVFTAKQLVADVIFTFVFVTACRPRRFLAPTLVAATG